MVTAKFSRKIISTLIPDQLSTKRLEKQRKHAISDIDFNIRQG